MLCTVPARPEPFAFDTSRTALLIIDMQNDFCSAGGMCDLAGVKYMPIAETIPRIAALVRVARKAAIEVIFLKMGFAANLSDAGGANSPTRIKHARLRAGDCYPDKPGQILVRGYWGTEIVTELAPQSGELELWKTRYSGFFETGLDDALRSHGKDSLLITGCTTSVCVDSTVRDAMFRDYRCLILEDCVAEPLGNSGPRTNHEASLLVFERLLGWVAGSEDAIAAIAA